MAITYLSSQRLPLLNLLLPWKIMAQIFSHGSLLKQFTKREVQRRYKGTLLGLFWSFITPLLMLSVYMLVFGFIFGGSYGHPGETKVQFGLGLFTGLLVWDFIAGAISASPGLIVANSNFVTKVIFPLEILPVAMVVSTLIHIAIGFIPLLLFLVISQGAISLSAISVILIFIPLFFYCLGLAWIISALGVFLRDIGAMIPALVTTLMFMSAIFFPLTAIPLDWRSLVMLNPAAVLISMARNALVFSQWPEWNLYGIQLLISIIVAILGYALFMKAKPAFADVL